MAVGSLGIANLIVLIRYLRYAGELIFVSLRDFEHDFWVMIMFFYTIKKRYAK